jgi:cytochrome c biogenesis protein CcmG, thiol:disulfide interchange protein DsbE
MVERRDRSVTADDRRWSVAGGLARAALVSLYLAGAGACATAGGDAGGTSGSSAASGGRVAGRSSGGSGVGRSAPEIVVERLDGRSLSLSSLRGKVVLLDVWASWCGPCKQELPMLDAIAGRLRGRGVEVLAVSVDQERDNVVKFLSGRAHWSLTVAHDPRGAIADTFQPDKMPTSYVIDRAGIIRHVNSGFETSDAPVIERRLAELADRGGGGGAAAGDTAGDRDGHGEKTARRARH